MFMTKLMRFVLPTVWAGAIVAGFWSLEQYKSIGGRAEATIVEPYPRAAADAAHAATSQRIVMYVHPHCPCTRASFQELTKIIRAGGERLAAEVVVVVEPGMHADWKDGAIVRAARDLPGVALRFDETGAEAQKFGAYTSGHTMLFAADGAPLFRGGITRSRGHEGENPGSRTIKLLLTDSLLVSMAKSQSMHAPVFGCPLFSREPCRDGACRVASVTQ